MRDIERASLLKKEKGEKGKSHKSTRWTNSYLGSLKGMPQAYVQKNPTFSDRIKGLAPAK